MFALALLSWWYGRGWAGVGKSIGTMTASIANAFSIPILIRTLFAPWRQIITVPGASLDAKLHAMADNAVSRAVGFVVRLIVLMAAGAMALLALAAGIILVVIWPLIPLAALALLVKGAMG